MLTSQPHRIVLFQFITCLAKPMIFFYIAKSSHILFTISKFLSLGVKSSFLKIQLVIIDNKCFLVAHVILLNSLDGSNVPV